MTVDSLEPTLTFVLEEVEDNEVESIGYLPELNRYLRLDWSGDPRSSVLKTLTLTASQIRELAGQDRGGLTAQIFARLGFQDLEPKPGLPKGPYFHTDRAVEDAIDEIMVSGDSLLYVEHEVLSNQIEIIRKIDAAALYRLRANPNELYELHPRAFEELVAELLAGYGWRISLTASTRDGGYDIFALVDQGVPSVETSWIIECKRYKPERKIGIEIVRAIYGVKNDLAVANVMLATTSHFTKDAQMYGASRWDLSLREYGDIVSWLAEYSPKSQGTLYTQEQAIALPAPNTERSTGRSTALFKRVRRR